MEEKKAIILHCEIDVSQRWERQETTTISDTEVDLQKVWDFLFFSYYISAFFFFLNVHGLQSETVINSFFGLFVKRIRWLLDRRQVIINLSARNNTGKMQLLSCSWGYSRRIGFDKHQCSALLYFLKIECYYDVSDTIIILSKHRRIIQKL